MTIIEFKSLDDFIADLREQASLIADKTVRWEQNTNTISDFVKQIEVWATALKKGGDDDYLLEFGAVAGPDDCEAEVAKDAGTVAAAKALLKLTEVCDDLGLKLRPGKIEVY